MFYDSMKIYLGEKKNLKCEKDDDFCWSSLLLAHFV